MAVSSAGVGAIYDLRVNKESLESVMMAGLDFWKPESMPVIREPQLARNLHVRDFRGMPAIPKSREKRELRELSLDRDSYLPAFRFPKILECQKCKRIGTEEDRQFLSKRGRQPDCTGTAGRECPGKGLPVRLVLSCDSSDEEGGHPGHVQEFPWHWWAHSNPNRNPKECRGGDLFLKGGSSITLAGLSVFCSKCESKRSLKDVFRVGLPQAFECHGKRPWLGSREAEKCGKAVRPLMRGASNVYFPVVASAISIPPFSKRLVSMIRSDATIMMQIHSQNLEPDVLVRIVKNLPAFGDYSDREILEAMASAAETGSNLTARTEPEQRAAEHRALVEGHGSQGDDFIAVPMSLDEVDRLDQLVDRVVKVPALREVRALRGFNRVHRSESSDPNTVSCAPLSKAPLGWLPAIEIRGEGVYVELDTNKVLTWQASEAVHERMRRVRTNVKRACEQDSRIFHEDRLPSAGEILAHTLAHLLINQLTLDCGYSTASLRERLYVGEGETDSSFGFLIYTGTHGADGTLGGLVSQGDPLRMEATLEAALDKARWCASDPICMESAGQGPNATNMAACHACCIVSETSCEKGNQFLDRGLVVGIMGEPGVGFFETTQGE
jgi:hypothetical protein